MSLQCDGIFRILYLRKLNIRLSTCPFLGTCSSFQQEEEPIIIADLNKLRFLLENTHNSAVFKFYVLVS